MTQYYQITMTGSDLVCRFDWNAVEWVSLPEIVALLSWSSRLVHLERSVEWVFRDPRRPVDGIDDMRFHTSLALGAELYNRFARQLDELRQKAMEGRLYPRERRLELRRIRNDACARRPEATSAVEKWLNSEAAPLGYMDVLAYLDRYKVFDRAAEVGIAMTPDPRGLPKSAMARTPDTACLELRAIQSLVEVGTLIEELSHPQELARILGEYTNLDVVRRGALAQILVAELGRNVGEHSNGSAAWLCTRLVADEQVAMQTTDDPALRSFRERGTGFLEVIVGDNGNGLTTGLESVLDKDQRESVRSKYTRNPDGHFADRDLVDYAFDRLSSTKRRL